jgi:hypothetical protein
MPPALLFLLKIDLRIQGLLFFHMIFWFHFSTSGKNDFGILMGIVLNLKIAFDSTAIFMILSLLIHKHGRSFHLLVSSSISFFSVLKFSLQKLFPSLVKFIHRYFLRLLWMGLFSWCLSQLVCYLCIEKLLIFVYWFCILLLCKKCLSDLWVFAGLFRGKLFFYLNNCNSNFYLLLYRMVSHFHFAL